MGGMTEPTPLEDLTADDGKVQRTDNGLRPDDPADQPPQDPGWVPGGTESEALG